MMYNHAQHHAVKGTSKGTYKIVLPGFDYVVGAPLFGNTERILQRSRSQVMRQTEGAASNSGATSCAFPVRRRRLWQRRQMDHGPAENSRADKIRGEAYHVAEPAPCRQPYQRPDDCKHKLDKIT